MDKPILEEWEITLRLRVDLAEFSRPDKWDYTTLLDLSTGKGEQAWVESAGVMRSGTEEDLNFINSMPEE